MGRKLGNPPAAGESLDDYIRGHIGFIRHVAGGIIRRSGLPLWIPIEDLVSDGMIGLWNAIRTYNPERSKDFRTYAFYRVRGEILDGLRTRSQYRRKAKGGDQALLHPKSLENAKFEDHELIELIRDPIDPPWSRAYSDDLEEKFIRILPVKMRETIRLFAFRGLTQAEVHRELGIPECTVYSRIKRAAKLLEEFSEIA